MWVTVATFIGSLAGIFVLFKYVLLMEVRIDARTFKSLYELLKINNKFVICEEFLVETKYPTIFSAICSIKGFPYFYINHSERLMNAGWQGKELITNITCFRWDYAKLKLLLTAQVKSAEDLGIPVDIILPNHIDRIGILSKYVNKPLINPKLWEDIDNEVGKVFDGKIDKVGVLLYGPPGNNKTYFIKYLAIKYKVPIKIITFTPNFSNHEIMKIFSNIGNDCIVIFEDFDNYFDGRKCIISEKVTFTFDVILNCLDGVYNNYEKVVFIMTANNIEKIDIALRNRPSRFKYVRKFDNPDEALRFELVPHKIDKELNLDQLLRVREYLDSGINLEESIKNVS